MTITAVPLSKLEHSPVNVRKTGGQRVDDLAASIEAHGLIQSLTVRESTKGKYEVVAGGRRLSALARLMKEKRSAYGEPVTKSFAVPCRVLVDEDATEISLAENAIRQAMHPADQFDAFKALADGGMSVADIAARFGATDKTVRQRLKLASLSPVLLAAFRKDEMTMEQAMAFSVSDDHVRQEEVWKVAKKEKGYYNGSPNGIRSALTGQAVRASSGLAKIIGDEAYVAAGGAISRDLFSTDDEAFWTDGELVERLAQERLAEIAAQVKAEGWGEVMTRVGHFSPYSEDVHQVQRVGREMTADEAAKRQALLDEQNTLVDDGTEEATARYDALDAEINAIEETAENDWSEVEGKERMIVVVVLNRNSGGIEVERGYVRDRDDAQNEVFDGSTARTSAKGKPESKEKPDISAALVSDMSARRTQAMQAAMLGQPDVALTAMLHALCAGRLYSRTVSSTVKLHLTPPALRTHAGATIDETEASRVLADAETRWRKRIPGDGGKLWGWLEALNAGERIELLTFLTANGVDAITHNPTSTLPHADQLHAALGLDMADWWEPTGASYLGRVPRDKVLEALAEAGEKPAALTAFRAMKKAALVEKAEKALADTRWLPTPLRAPEAVAVANENVERGEAA